MINWNCLVAKKEYPRSVLIEDRGSVVVVLGVIRKETTPVGDREERLMAGGECWRGE